MSSGFYGDYTSAIFGGITDSIKKLALVFGVPVFGSYIGMNCVHAPTVIANLRAGGFAGLSTVTVSTLLGGGEPFAVTPLYWVAAVFMSFTHFPTFLYPLVLVYAWLKLWLSDDEWWRWAAFILIIQPIDTWYLFAMSDSGMSRGDFALSAVILGMYEAALIGASIWYSRQREAFE